MAVQTTRSADLAGTLREAAGTVRQHGTVIVFLILQMGWVRSLFMNPGSWSILLGVDQALSDSTYTAFVVTLCAAMTLAAGLLRPERIRTVVPAVSGLAAAACIVMAMGRGPAAAWAGSIALGGASGATLAIVIHLAVYSIPAPGRAVPVAFALLGFSAVGALITAIGPMLGRTGLMLVELAFMTAPFLIFFRLPTPARFLDFEAVRFPVPLMTILFVLSFALYFEVFGIDSIRTFLGSPRLPPTAFWLVRILVTAAFILVGRRLHMVYLLYASFVLLILSFSMNLIGPGWAIPGEIALAACIACTEISIDVIALDLAYRHARNRLTLVLTTVAIQGAIATGQVAGSFVGPVVAAAPAASFAVLIAVICPLFFLMPRILTLFDRELGAVKITGGDDGFVRNASYASVSPKRAVALLEEHFSGEFGLSPREADVARLLLDRYDYRTMALSLSVSLNTLKVHVKNIYKKCDVSGRRELIEMVSTLSRAGHPSRPDASETT